jgi:hypothetical protein
MRTLWACKRPRDRRLSPQIDAGRRAAKLGGHPRMIAYQQAGSVRQQKTEPSRLLVMGREVRPLHSGYRGLSSWSWSLTDRSPMLAVLPLWSEGVLPCHGVSGIPSYLTRVLSALGVYHLLVGPKQPWWNGVVERYVRTCRQEVVLLPPEDSVTLPHAIETARHFYNEQRCHSRCQDQPPATVYQPSARRLPAGFDPAQTPFTTSRWCCPARSKPVAASTWPVTPSRSASAMPIRPSR